MTNYEFVRNMMESDRTSEPMTEQRAADILRWMRNDDEDGTIPEDLTPDELVRIWYYIAAESGMVRNEHGLLFLMDAARNLMDDDLCEQIHGTVDTDQEFFDAYCKLHEQKYGEPFELAKENPVW